MSSGRAEFEALLAQKRAEAYHDAIKDVRVAVREARHGRPIEARALAVPFVRPDLSEEQLAHVNADITRTWRVVYFAALREEFERLAATAQSIDAALAAAGEQ